MSATKTPPDFLGMPPGYEPWRCNLCGHVTYARPGKVDLDILEHLFKAHPGRVHDEPLSAREKRHLRHLERKLGRKGARA